MNRCIPHATAVAALVVVPLMVFVVPVGLAGAAPTSASSGTSPSEWAYGAVKNVSFSGTTSTDWTWTLTATYGYTVVLYEPNPSANPFEVAVNRTMGVGFSFLGCKPSCADPSIGKGTVEYHAVETSSSFANFTNTGAVYENSASVPALALVNSSSFASANLTTNAALYAEKGLVNWSTYFTVATHSSASVSFSSPLGLIPINLSASQSWNDSAGYSAIGSTSYRYFGAYATEHAGSGFVGPIMGSVTVTGTGTVGVLGSYGGQTIVFNGVSYPVLSIAVSGPFSAREGFILLPSEGDLFSSAALPWTANQSSEATVQLSNVDALALFDGHFGIAASSWVYQSTSVNPGDYEAPPTAAAETGGGSEVTAAAVAPAVTIQGAPLEPGAVSPINGCLVSGTGCPSTSGSTSPARPLLGLLGIAVVAVVIAAVVASVVVVERRRTPPPVYPNANLYPPGTHGTPYPGRRTGAPGSPPAPTNEEDPLNHLW